MSTPAPGYLLLQGDAARIPLPDQSVSFCFGSPPYCDCRTYLEDGRDLGIARGLTEWVEWMLAVTMEALRVTSGAVVWVASGKTEGRNYWPACEGLMWEWHKRGGHAYRPCIWQRQGMPGKYDWFRSDTEYVMSFKRPGALPWSDLGSVGTETLVPGESFRGLKGGRRSNGKYRGCEAHALNHDRVQPEIAWPSNVFKTPPTSSCIGSPLASHNEAPFPEILAEFFIRSLCPPGGTVLDPFSGSGTTSSVALRLGRNAIGLDLRASQCRIARQRIDHPHAPVTKAHKQTDSIGPLFDMMGVS